MRKAVFVICFVLLVAFLSISAVANDVWKGLELKSSTQEDVVKAVGEPKRRRFEKIKIAGAPGGNITGQKALRVFEYEKIDGWEKVALTFMDDRLFKIKFWPRNKSLVASSLPSTYEADFVYVQGLSNKVPLSVFEGQKEPAVPHVYDTVYFMVSAKADRYILVSVNNGSWKAFTRQMKKKPTIESFPGFVEDIEIISRGWETKGGDADVRDASKGIDS